jgi:hypothetical protein
LTVLFQFDWLIFTDRATYDAFENLLASFVSSNVGFIKPVFELLISNFVLKDDDASEDEPTQVEKCNALHRAIRRILKMNPLACGYMSQVVSELYPSSFNGKKQGHFVHQILRLGEDIPALKESLLTQIIERLLSIDVELTGLQEITSPNEEEMNQVIVLADRADVILCEIFDYIDREMSTTNKPMRLFASRLFLQIFDRCVLRTGNAKTTQYFMFYASRKSLSMTRNFITFLFERVKDVEESNRIRRAAALFWGSFLARANFIPTSLLTSHVDEAWDWLKLQLNSSNSSNVTSPRSFSPSSSSGFMNNNNPITPKNNIQIPVLAAMLQSLMYVSVYKSRKLGNQFMNHVIEEKMTRDVWNKLKTSGCTVQVPSSVIHEFTKLSPEFFNDDLISYHHHTFMKQQHHHQQQQNEIMMMGSESRSSSLMLNKFSEFPFDPIVLDLAKQKIDPYHVAWTSSQQQSQQSVDDGENHNEDDLSSLSSDDDGMSDLETSGDEDDLLSEYNMMMVGTNNNNNNTGTPTPENLPASLTINIGRVMSLLNNNNNYKSSGSSSVVYQGNSGVKRTKMNVVVVVNGEETSNSSTTTHNNAMGRTILNNNSSSSSSIIIQNDTTGKVVATPINNSTSILKNNNNSQRFRKISDAEYLGQGVFGSW